MANINSLQSGLIAHYPLNGEYGADDITPYSHNMTAYGGISVGTATGRKGESNGSTEFDGTSDYLEGSFDYSGDVFSISAWVFSNDNESRATQGVFGWRNYDGERRELYISQNNRLTAFIPVSYKISNSLSTNYFYNSWHHIAVTYSGSGDPVFYVDGQSLGVSSSTDYTTTFNPNVSRIGNILNSDPANIVSNWGIDGKITDVRAYNRELSADEVKLLYEKGRH